MKHPVQNTHTDAHGRLRFVSNDLVRGMVDKFEYGGYTGLNALYLYHKEKSIGCEDDYSQLMQLVGYDVSGFRGLSTTTEEGYKVTCNLIGDFNK